MTVTMPHPDLTAFRLKWAFADYFDHLLKGVGTTALYVGALREGLIAPLIAWPMEDRSRRGLLIVLRQNEQLYQQVTGRPTDDPRVRVYLDELDALLAQERAAHRQKGITP